MSFMSFEGICFKETNEIEGKTRVLLNDNNKENLDWAFLIK